MNSKIHLASLLLRKTGILKVIKVSPVIMQEKNRSKGLRFMDSNKYYGRTTASRVPSVHKFILPLT